MMFCKHIFELTVCIYGLCGNALSLYPPFYVEFKELIELEGPGGKSFLWACTHKTFLDTLPKPFIISLLIWHSADIAVASAKFC